MVLKDRLGNELCGLSVCSKQVLNCQHCSSRVSKTCEILRDTVAVQEEEEQQKVSSLPFGDIQVKYREYRDTIRVVL